jgi:hypothetical protein
VPTVLFQSLGSRVATPIHVKHDARPGGPRDPSSRVEHVLLRWRRALAVEVWSEQALRNRGWTFVEESPGSILATIDVRSHEVVSRITYTGSSLEFAYVSRKDMMYQVSSNGIEKIHRNYNGWIANVVRDTQPYLEGRQPEGGLNQ